MSSHVLSICLFITFVWMAAVSSIPIDEEKPLSCPANEKYYKCSWQVCYTTCAHLKKNPPCASLSPDCYHPECLCPENTFRNDKGACVSEDECLS